jgi:hypothetical protein
MASYGDRPEHVSTKIAFSVPERRSSTQRNKPMDSTANLYARTAAGLLVPREAVPPPLESYPTQVLFCALPKAKRDGLLKRGYEPRCACGKRVSANVPCCAACAVSDVMMRRRALESGLVLPGGAK